MWNVHRSLPPLNLPLRKGETLGVPLLQEETLLNPVKLKPNLELLLLTVNYFWDRSKSEGSALTLACDDGPERKGFSE